MKVLIKKVVEIPANLYCDGCQFLKHDQKVNKEYCMEYIPFLEVDQAGKIIKCEQCLLNLRKNIIMEDR